MPPAVALVKSLWKVRAGARSSILIYGFLLCVTSVLFTDSDYAPPKLYLALMIAYIMTLQYMNRRNYCESVQQLAFGILIGLFSSGHLFYFTLYIISSPVERTVSTATSGPFRLFMPLNNVAEMLFEDAHRRMVDGQIPCPLVPLSLALPTLATAAGMDVRLAKVWTFFNALLFIALVSVLWWRTVSATDNEVTLRAARGSLLHECMFAVGLSVLCLTACAPGVAAGNEIIKLMNASSVADTVLHHTLKNSIAGALALLEVDMQDGDPLHQPAHQKQAMRQLSNSMRWCALRVVLLELAAGQYTTACSPVNIPQFAQKIVEGYAVPFEFVDETTEEAISFDELLTWLALENAISNVVAHGRSEGTPSNLLGVRFDRQKSQICFTIKNGVPEAASGVRPMSTHACEGAGGSFKFDISDEKGRAVALFTLKMPAVALTTSLSASSTPSPSQTPASVRIPESLKVCAIDDSIMLCKSYDRIFLTQLKADRSTSIICCPETAEDVAAFIKHILTAPAADIVILDQNIDLRNGAPTVLGTELADELRLQQYNGLIAVRSANSTSANNLAYMLSGAVDVCIGKHLGNASAVSILSDAFFKKL